MVGVRPFLPAKRTELVEMDLLEMDLPGDLPVGLSDLVGLASFLLVVPGKPRVLSVVRDGLQPVLGLLEAWRVLQDQVDHQAVAEVPLAS